MPRRKAVPVEEIEETELEAEEAPPTRPTPTPKRQPAPKKKTSGEQFLSQPFAVGLLAPGLGWLSAKAFGVENAMKRKEAEQVSTGILRIVGRHFLKNVDMGALAKTEGDIADVLDIGKGLGTYIIRQMEERQRRAEQARKKPEPAGDAAARAAGAMPQDLKDVEEELAMPTKPFNGTVHVPAFMGTPGEV